MFVGFIWDYRCTQQMNSTGYEIDPNRVLVAIKAKVTNIFSSIISYIFYEYPLGACKLITRMTRLLGGRVIPMPLVLRAFRFTSAYQLTSCLLSRDNTCTSSEELQHPDLKIQDGCSIHEQ